MRAFAPPCENGGHAIARSLAGYLIQCGHTANSSFDELAQVPTAVGRFSVPVAVEAPLAAHKDALHNASLRRTGPVIPGTQTNTSAFLDNAATRLWERGRRKRMVTALEINVALWGMLICTEIEIAEWVRYVLS